MKDTEPVLRTSRLKAYLTMIDRQYMKQICAKNKKIKVLLEFQMGFNDKSRNVCSQILYHYSATDTGFKRSNLDDWEMWEDDCLYDVEIVGPSLKNKINFVEGKDLSYYMEKYSKRYDANKNHSKDNFLHWVKSHGYDDMIKNIKKKNLDDIGDSFNMAVAWLFIKSGLF